MTPQVLVNRFQLTIAPLIMGIIVALFSWWLNKKEDD